MKYGKDALTTGRHTVYIPPKLFRLTKAAAAANSQSWSEYVADALHWHLQASVRVPEDKS